MGIKIWFCECFMWFLNILSGTVPQFLKQIIQSRRNVHIDARMFASTHECTRAHWESTVQCKTHKIRINHRAQRSKFAIRNASLRLASMHNSSISMNHLLRIIYLVLTGFNLSNQESAQKSSSITMDIDTATLQVEDHSPVFCFGMVAPHGHGA